MAIGRYLHMQTDIKVQGCRGGTHCPQNLAPNASCPVAWVSFLFDFIIYIFFTRFHPWQSSTAIVWWPAGRKEYQQHGNAVGPCFSCVDLEIILCDCFDLKLDLSLEKWTIFIGQHLFRLVFFYHQMISNKNRSQFSPMKVCNQMTLQSNLNWSGNGQLLRLCAVALLRRTTFVTFDRLK